MEWLNYIAELHEGIFYLIQLASRFSISNWWWNLWQQAWKIIGTHYYVIEHDSDVAVMTCSILHPVPTQLRGCNTSCKLHGWLNPVHCLHRPLPFSEWFFITRLFINGSLDTPKSNQLSLIFKLWITHHCNIMFKLATGTGILASTSAVLYVVSAVAVLSAVVLLAITAYFHYNHWRFSHIPQPKRPRYNSGLWYDIKNTLGYYCHAWMYKLIHKQMWLFTQSPWCSNCWISFTVSSLAIYLIYFVLRRSQEMMNYPFL